MRDDDVDVNVPDVDYDDDTHDDDDVALDHVP